MSFRDCIGTVKQGGVEILVHEVKRYYDMLNAKTFAMDACTFYFTCVMIAAVVKGEGNGYFILVVVEKGRAVHATRQYYYAFFFHILMLGVLRMQYVLNCLSVLKRGILYSIVKNIYICDVYVIA